MKPKEIKLLWILESGQDHAPTCQRALVYDKDLSCLLNRNTYLRWRYPYRDIRNKLRESLLRAVGATVFARLLSALLAELGRGGFNLLLFFRILLAFPRHNRFIYLRTFPGFFQRFLIGLLRKKIYFDFDDALYLKRPAKEEGVESVEGEENPIVAKKMSRFIRRCRGVIVSNGYLAAWARTSNPNVAVIPTSVEIHPSFFCSYENTPEIVIGWTGAPENQKYLLSVFPAIREVLDAFPHARLHVITSTHWKYPHPRVRLIPWDKNTFHAETQKFAVGLAPLCDTAWTRGKMQFKAIQYAAHGVPIVGSPVGFDLSLWKDGENVCFADRPEAYREKIMDLLFNVEKRRAIGTAGRKTVERYFNPSVNANLLVRCLSLD